MRVSISAAIGLKPVEKTIVTPAQTGMTGTQRHDPETANGHEFTRIGQSQLVHASVVPAPVEAPDRNDLSLSSRVLLRFRATGPATCLAWANRYQSAQVSHSPRFQSPKRGGRLDRKQRVNEIESVRHSWTNSFLMNCHGPYGLFAPSCTS